VPSFDVVHVSNILAAPLSLSIARARSIRVMPHTHNLVQSFVSQKLYTEGYIEGWHRLGSPSDSSGYHQGQVLLCMQMIIWGEEDKRNPLTKTLDFDLAPGLNIKQIATNSVPIPHASSCRQLPAFDDPTVDFSALYGSTVMG
jgi:hypothetical protein